MSLLDMPTMHTVSDVCTHMYFLLVILGCGTNWMQVENNGDQINCYQNVSTNWLTPKYKN